MSTSFLHKQDFKFTIKVRTLGHDHVVDLNSTSRMCKYTVNTIKWKSLKLLSFVCPHLSGVHIIC